MSQALSNIAVGSKIKFGKYQVNAETPQEIIWTVVAKNHQCTPAYPTNAITLHAAEILDLRCFDAKEPSNSDSDRQNYGNNRYSVSNLDQWLNKDAAGGAWYSAAHSADHSPDTTAGTGGYGTQYATRPGFLNGFTDDEKAAILSTTIRVVKSSVDGGSYEDVVRKVFLPSTTEVGLPNENSIAEGAAWGYYTSGTARIGYVTQQCFSNTPSSSTPSSKTTAWHWWLRTPGFSYAYYVLYVHSNGYLNYRTPYFGKYGVRPALNLSSSLLVSDSMDTDGCYTVVWESEPEQPTTYTATVQNDGNGTASASPTTAEAGTEITLTATANTGYHFSEWQVISPATGITISDNKFTMPSSDVTVKAIFAEDSTPDVPDEPETNEVLTAIRNHAKQDIIITPLTGTGGAIRGSDIAVTGGGFVYTSVLNGDNDFTAGRAVSAQIETTLVNDSGQFTNYDFNRLFSVSLSILTNPEAESETDEYTEISLGVFQGERPEKVRGKLIEFRLYDLMTMCDISAEEFITSLTFPTTLGAIYTSLCNFVGLTPSQTSGFTNSTKNFTANPFSSAGYTAREVLAWIAEAAGCYARMDEDGKVELIEFGTFAHKVLLTDRFEMSENEFVVPKIGKLEVYNSYGDQLVTAGTGSNTYVISDNPFLYIENDTEITSLQPFVTAIYNRLTLFPAYHPASVRCEWYPLIKCGDIITVIDDYGDEITFPVFSQTVTWNGFGKVEYENTGSVTRDIAPVRQRELEEIKKKMLRTADLSTAVKSYLNTQEGKASITSAVEGKFVEVATGSTITSTTQIEQLVENTENGINSKISISAGVGKGTIGSNVQALLTLFANTDTSSIRLSANALTLEATPGASGTVDTETGTLHVYSTYGATDDSTVKFFAKTSDGYYTSQNAGIANSFAYGRLDFSFTSQTTVKLKCISYGESNFDYGIVSTLDSDLLWSRTADTSGVLHSFKGESSSSVQTLTLTVPSGSHYITFKYIKDSSNDSNDDTFKIRAYAETEAPSTSSVISLKSGGVQISSANVNFPGLVTFGDLAGDMTTKINGGNISTENLKVKQVFYNAATEDESFLILTSSFEQGTRTITLGGESDGYMTDIEFRTKYVTFATPDGSPILFLSMNASGGKIVPFKSSQVWDIGNSSKPFGTIYVDKITFGDGTSMTTKP